MRVTLLHVLMELERRIGSSQNLIVKVRNLGMPRTQIEIIAELAFLRVFIAWENFLEESFIRYAIGAESPAGYRPTRLVSPQNMRHVLHLISSGKDYVRWNSASEVIRRSEAYFSDGKPYKNVLQGATVDLDNMNTIRNRIAHKSVISKDKFNNFARRKIGHGIRGMTPGRFLLRLMSSTSQTAFFDYYVRIIETASRIIVR